MSSAGEILKRFDDMKTERRYYESHWEEIARYITPNKRGIIAKLTQGGKRTDYQVDSTASYCLNLLSSTLASSITSPSIRWFSLKHRKEEINQIQEVLEWLDEVLKRMYLAYQQSALYTEINNNIYTETPAFGTGCLQVEEKTPDAKEFSGFLFKGISIEEYYGSEGIDGTIDTIFREFKLSARVAVERWGIENVGDKLRDAFNNKPDSEFDFLHAVFPRIGSDENAISSKKMKWASFFISLCDKKIISESGYKSFPFVVPRWSKYSGEVYGRGIGGMALPDIKTLNEAKRYGLKSLALSLSPPMQELQDSVISRVALTPGARIIVTQPGALTPIPLGFDRQGNLIEINELREAIKQMFFAHHIESIMALDAPRRTATEVRMKYEIMQWLLGPVLTNIETEFLNPLVDRTFDMMLSRGAFPKINPTEENPLGLPQALFDSLGEASGRQIDIVYESPLAKAQKLEELRGIESLYAMGATIAPVYPAVFDPIDHDVVMRETSKIVGVPMNIFRNQEEIDRIREERDQAQLEAQEKRDTMEIAERLKKLTPLIKEGGNGQGISNQRIL